ncbi:hypothetical protein JKP88DRAFT_272400 [Tribonema minus]|uniref:Uncharacterized protein n=1 Tax=Tribonema minus TaxID=303371 RepID=A0A835ZEQ6_9STRA|nr:hypothetical protein JKP88DRAFT_272400 [Tribonema minus]
MSAASAADGRWNFRGVKIAFGSRDKGTTTLCIAAVLKMLGLQADMPLSLGNLRPCDIALLPVPSPREAAHDGDADALCALGGNRCWLLELCAASMLDLLPSAQYKDARDILQEIFGAFLAFARTPECRSIRAQVLQQHVAGLARRRAAAAAAAAAAAPPNRDTAARSAFLAFARHHCMAAITGARAEATRVRGESGGSGGGAYGASAPTWIAEDAVLRRLQGELVASLKGVPGGFLTGRIEHKPADGRTNGNYWLRIGSTSFGPVFPVVEPALLLRDTLALLLGQLNSTASMVDGADNALVVLGLFATTADLVPVVSRAGDPAGQSTQAGYHLRGRSADLLEFIAEEAKERKGKVQSGSAEAAVWEALRGFVAGLRSAAKRCAQLATCREGLRRAAARRAAGLAAAVHPYMVGEGRFPFWAEVRALPALQLPPDAEPSQMGHLPPTVLERQPDHSIALHLNGTKLLATKCCASAAVIANLVDMLVRGEAMPTAYLHAADWPKLHLVPLPAPLLLSTGADGDRRMRRHVFALDVLRTKEGKLRKALGEGELLNRVLGRIGELLDHPRLLSERAVVLAQQVQLRMKSLQVELRQRRRAGDQEPLDTRQQQRPRTGAQAKAAANAILRGTSTLFPGTGSTDLPDAFFTPDARLPASEDVERNVGETKAQRWLRDLDSRRRNACHAVVGSTQELQDVFAAGGVTVQSASEDGSVTHALLAAEMAGVGRWEAEHAMPVLWRAHPLTGEMVPLEEGETTELVVTDNGTSHHQKPVVQRNLAEWCRQQHNLNVPRGIIGRLVPAHPVARATLLQQGAGGTAAAGTMDVRAAAAAALEWPGPAGNSSAGSSSDDGPVDDADEALAEAFDAVALDPEADVGVVDGCKPGRQRIGLGGISRDGTVNFGSDRLADMLEYTAQQRNNSVFAGVMHWQRRGEFTAGEVAMQAQLIADQLFRSSEPMHHSLYQALLRGGRFRLTVEQLPRSESGEAQLCALQDWQPPDTCATWFTREQFEAMVNHHGDLLVARPTGADAAPSDAKRYVLVDFHRLLVSLVLDRCALDRVFYEWVDGQLCELVGRKVIVMQGYCCKGTRPWMQVSLPGRRFGRLVIKACAVVVASACLGGLTAAKPVADGAEFRATGGMRIILAAGAAAAT